MATTIDPKRTALLVMDFQAMVIGSVPDGDGIVSREKDLIEVARSRGVTIAYAKLTLGQQDLESISPRNKAFSEAAGYLPAAGAPELAIPESIAPQAGDIVVNKTRVGAFSTNNLDQLLRGRDIDTLLVTGLWTSGVVLSTVRDVCDKDYRVVVVQDCCGDADPEVHAFLVEKIFAHPTTVVAASEVAGLLG